MTTVVRAVGTTRGGNIIGVEILREVSKILFCLVNSCEVNISSIR